VDRNMINEYEASFTSSILFIYTWSN